MKLYQMIQFGGGIGVDYLTQHPLFRQVEPETLLEIQRSAEIISVPRGETAYDRQRFQRCLGILLNGKLQVRKESLLISTLQQGDVFGAAALFNDREEYPTTLTALADCRLMLIPQEVVCTLLRTCGGFAEDYVSYLSGRIHFLSARLDAVSAERGEGKLARYLLNAGQSSEVTVTATQLCQRIGVGRATLYRAFDVLERDGSIARAGKAIRILDREKLHAICEHG